jgi:hypothetical protein
MRKEIQLVYVDHTNGEATCLCQVKGKEFTFKEIKKDDWTELVMEYNVIEREIPEIVRTQELELALKLL